MFHAAKLRISEDNTKKIRKINCNEASPDTIGGVAYISCFIHLSGTRLSTQPTKPGLYINSRHKVVIK